MANAIRSSRKVGGLPVSIPRDQAPAWILWLDSARAKVSERERMPTLKVAGLTQVRESSGSYDERLHRLMYFLSAQVGKPAEGVCDPDEGFSPEKAVSCLNSIVEVVLEITHDNVSYLVDVLNETRGTFTVVEAQAATAFNVRWPDKLTLDDRLRCWKTEDPRGAHAHDLLGLDFAYRRILLLLLADWLHKCRGADVNTSYWYEWLPDGS